MKVLITGGTGSLGRLLVQSAHNAGHAGRIMSRRSSSQLDSTSATGVEWTQADLASGKGLAAAVAGVDAILHSASDPRSPDAVDVLGTRNLCKAAWATHRSELSGPPHIVYISIVGIDQIPLGYYKRKLAAEEIIRASGLPYSILRATQFHSFVEMLISQAARVPLVLPLPTNFKFQTVDDSEVAERMVGRLDDGPGGEHHSAAGFAESIEFGGPEVLSLGEMAQAWLKAKDRHKILIHLPLSGAIAAGFRAGRNTTAASPRGMLSWGDWLKHRVGDSGRSNVLPNRDQ